MKVLTSKRSWYFTGSQCSSRNTGIMCSLLRDLVIRLDGQVHVCHLHNSGSELCFFTISLTILVYMQYSFGPNTDPCGTPQHRCTLMSLNCGTFPTRFKRANVISVYKKGDKRNVCNYIPISLLPLFSKHFEKVMYDHVRNTISGSQHGFARCRSTVSNLACYLDSISESIDNKKQLDFVYLLTINSQA